MLGYNVVRFVIKFSKDFVASIFMVYAVQEEWAKQISNPGLFESCEFFVCSIKCLINFIVSPCIFQFNNG